MFSIHFFRYRCRNTRTDFIEILRNQSLLASLLISLFSARWSVRVISLFAKLYRELLKTNKTQKMFSIHFFRYRCRNTRTDFIEILRNQSLLASLLISLFSARWSVRVISLFAKLYRELLKTKNLKKCSRYISFATAAETLELTS